MVWLFFFLQIFWSSTSTAFKCVNINCRHQIVSLGSFMATCDQLKHIKTTVFNALVFTALRDRNKLTNKKNSLNQVSQAQMCSVLFNIKAFHDPNWLKITNNDSKTLSKLIAFFQRSNQRHLSLYMSVSRPNNRCLSHSANKVMAGDRPHWLQLSVCAEEGPPQQVLPHVKNWLHLEHLMQISSVFKLSRDRICY